MTGAGDDLDPAAVPARPISVLVVDDEAALGRALAKLFRAPAYRVRTAESGREALQALANEAADVVLLDIMMPDLTGTDVLPRIKTSWPGVEVVMMTAYGTIERAVACIRAGAYDFLTKPFVELDQVRRTVDRAAERARLVERNRFLERQLDPGERRHGLVGSSPALQAMLDVIEVVRRASSTVLVRGESGTGKELVARGLHLGSPRRDRPFIPVNCSAVPETLLESELFGHARFAFTDAKHARAGLFEQADGGTLFLDEIGDMPPALQAKLLRVLEDREIRRLGATETRRVDVRVIAATHVDLHRSIEEGRFREDLYYRLNVITIEVPPLRERAEDIPLLAHHFLRIHAARNGRGDVRSIDPDALERLVGYAWPGNVRELSNAIERGVVLSAGSMIEAAALPAEVRGRGGRSEVAPERAAAMPFQMAKMLALQAFEQRYVRELLAETSGNVSEAARRAEMDRSNFTRLVKRYRP